MGVCSYSWRATRATTRRARGARRAARAVGFSGCWVGCSVGSAWLMTVSVAKFTAVFAMLLLTAAGLSRAPAPPSSRGAQLFAERGLLVEAWVNDADLTRGDLGDLDDFFESGFVPTFYATGSWWGPDIMGDPRASEWSLASVGEARYNVPPVPGNEGSPRLLSANQSTRASDLASLCLGDENQYNRSLASAWAEWAALAHTQVPRAAIHTNQWLGEWSFADYQQTLALRPGVFDLVVIDNYAFPGGSPPGSEPRNTSAVSLMQACATVRDTSLHANAPGQPPLPFGYYLQGYETKPGYTLSAAQIRAYYYLPLAMGAKWLNMFRWSAPWVGFKHGRRTASYFVFQQANAAVRSLSPLLSQLQTTRLELVPGYHIDPITNLEVPNTPPGFYGSKRTWPGPTQPVASNFSAGGAVLSNVSVRNLGTANGGLAEDVLLCHFAVLPSRSVPGADSTPPPQATQYFAIWNGLVPDAPDDAHGAGTDLGDVEITITLGQGVKRLREWVVGGGEGGWVALALPPPHRAIEGVPGGRSVRIAVGGGMARFYEAVL